MTDALPAPPLPATVDLRDFPYMPLDVVRLRDSDLAALETAEAFRAAVLLWAASWHQVPAASLPDDDRVLSNLAGFGRVVAEWRKVREGALRGFTRCADGRLYHLVVAEKAIDAWRSRLERRWRADQAAEKKRAGRAKREPVYLAFNLWISRECPEAAPYLSRWTGENVPEDKAQPSPGRVPDVTGETASNRREGKGSLDSRTTGVNGDSSARAEPPAGGSDQPRDPSLVARIVAECTRAKMPEASAEDPTIARWIEAGATPAHVAAGIAECARSWRNPGPITAAYCDDAVRRHLEAHRTARRQAKAREDRTQADLAESRAAKATQAPMPDHVRGQIRKGAQA